MATRLTYNPEAWARFPAHSPPGWLRYVVQLIQDQVRKKSPVSSVLHHKGIRYLDRSAYVLKGVKNRLRIILQARSTDAGEMIDAYVSIPTPVQPDSPYLPRYPLHGDPRIHHTRWALDEQGLNLLSLACQAWLTEWTCYKDAEHRRIPLSLNVTEGFAFGKIVKAQFFTHHPQTKEAIGMWALDIHEGYVDAVQTPSTLLVEPKTYWVEASAITFYNAVAVGYILIYKSEREADIASVGSIQAFCHLVKSEPVLA